MKIKRLTFTAMVRSKLEHASQVWCANTKQAAMLESIQHSGCVWMLRVNSKTSRIALRKILGLPSLKARRDMLRLFYVGILLSKSLDTWPRQCFETEPSPINKVIGISQSHWITRFQNLLNAYKLQDSYETVLEHSKVWSGVLQDYSPPSGELITPVKDWCSSVRKAIADRAVEIFRAAVGNQHSLEVLGSSTDSALRRAVNLINRSSHHANWIRIRLLAGTSSLNSTMTRITRGRRPGRCPV